MSTEMDKIRKLIASGQKSETESSEEAWNRKKAEFAQYQNTSDYKEGIVGELVMQHQIYSKYPHDPSYNPRAAYNYIYLFSKDNTLVGKETRVAKSSKKKDK